MKTRNGRNPSFVISPTNRTDGRVYVEKFKKQLADSGVFSSKKVENVNFGFPNCFEHENIECFKLVLRELENMTSYMNYKAFVHSSKKPFIEIFGDDKNEIMQEIQETISDIKNRIKNQKLPMFYYAEIKLKRYQFTTVLLHLDSLRHQFPGIEFNVISGSSFNQNDLILPTVQFKTTDKVQGIKCYEEINGKISQANLKTTSTAELPDIHCCKCLKQVNLRKFADKKDKKEQCFFISIGGSTIADVKCLAICGCIYCPSCLFITASEQIQAEIFANVGLKCTNVSKVTEKICKQTIMNQDLKDNLSRKQWEQILEAAWNAHVKFWVDNPSLTLKSGVLIETCSECSHPFKRDSKMEGVFICPKYKCKGYYCTKCKSGVTNEVGFETHQTECMGIIKPRIESPAQTRSFQTPLRSAQLSTSRPNNSNERKSYRSKSQGPVSRRVFRPRERFGNID